MSGPVNSKGPHEHPDRQSTRVLVQGITGSQSRFDVRYCLDYGTNIVGGVTPGRGGETVEGVPVFNTVAAAMAAVQPNATAIYVPARGVKDAVQEAVDAGIKIILATSENVPRHELLSPLRRLGRQEPSWLASTATG